MVTNDGASPMAIADQAPGRELRRVVSPRAFSVPSLRASASTLPLLLGACYGLIAVLLVWVELAQPSPGDGFSGIRFSNTVNSKGAREIVALFRDHLTWLPNPFPDRLSPNAYLTGLIVAWGGMIVLQIAAVLASRRTAQTSPVVWGVGPVLASLCLLAYPPTSTDVYAYASFGWVADRGVNPYLVAPDALSGDPYARFNDWTHIQTPYGPIWTGISRGVVHISNHEAFATAIGFKIVAMLAAVGLAGLTYRLAKRATNDPRHALTAFVLVAWSPILITESAATVHLDSLMMLLAMLGFAVAISGRSRAHPIGLALTFVSALVKPVTLPLAAMVVLTRLARAERPSVIARRVVADVGMMAAIALIAFSPVWNRHLPETMFNNLRTLYVSHPLRSNPLWVWALAKVEAVVDLSGLIGGNAGTPTRWVAMPIAVGIVLACGAAMLRLRQRACRAGTPIDQVAVNRVLLRAWTGITLALGVLPVNAHPWYVIWSLSPLALLWVTDGYRTRARPPIWLAAVSGWTLVSFLLYHTMPI